MQNIVQQFQAAEETRVVAPKEVEESPWQKEAVSTRKEAESAEKVVLKEKQIVQNKERCVETAAADCRVQGSLFPFSRAQSCDPRSESDRGSVVGHDQRSGC